MIVVVNDHFLMKRPFLYESSPWTHCPGQDLGERGLGSSLAACFSGYVPFQLYPEESIIILEANAKPYAYHGMGDNGWSLHDWCLVWGVVTIHHTTWESNWNMFSNTACLCKPVGLVQPANKMGRKEALLPCCWNIRSSHVRSTDTSLTFYCCKKNILCTCTYYNIYIYVFLLLHLGGVRLSHVKTVPRQQRKSTVTFCTCGYASWENKSDCGFPLDEALDVILWSVYVL